MPHLRFHASKWLNTNKIKHLQKFDTLVTFLNIILSELVYFYAIITGMKTLARFIQSKREDLGLTQKGLSIAANVPLDIIEEVEDGKSLFLSVTVRQALAKVLKCEPSEIKHLEKDIAGDIVSPEIIESLKKLILNGAGGLKCPKCGAPLDTRIARMYDLEDNLILHPKAHCTKCPFQIHS